MPPLRFRQEYYYRGAELTRYFFYQINLQAYINLYGLISQW